MKKAILVIDMPESCKRCDFWYEWAEEFECTRCGKRFPKSKFEIKQDWCPLRPLPTKYDVDIDEPYALGYNACIDEIAGGENNESNSNM